MSNNPLATAMEWLSMYIPVFIGFGFVIWSLIVASQSPNLYYYVGMLCGFFAAINQLDRNVYYKRIGNLVDSIAESEKIDVEIERVNYTDYRIKEEDE